MKKRYDKAIGEPAEPGTIWWAGPQKAPTPAEIRKARELAKLTQAQAAEIAGYAAPARWADLEAGRQDMPLWRWRYFRHVAGIERMPFRSCTYDPPGDR